MKSMATVGPATEARAGYGKIRTFEELSNMSTEEEGEPMALFLAYAL
jgi:hypothetical protein